MSQELETVQTEVEGLIRQANEGGDMSNIKSSASGRFRASSQPRAEIGGQNSGKMPSSSVRTVSEG